MSLSGWRIEDRWRSQFKESRSRTRILGEFPKTERVSISDPLRVELTGAVGYTSYKPEANMMRIYFKQTGDAKYKGSKAIQ